MYLKILENIYKIEPCVKCSTVFVPAEIPVSFFVSKDRRCIGANFYGSFWWYFCFFAEPADAPKLLRKILDGKILNLKGQEVKKNSGSKMAQAIRFWQKSCDQLKRVSSFSPLGARICDVFRATRIAEHCVENKFGGYRNIVKIAQRDLCRKKQEIRFFLGELEREQIVVPKILQDWLDLHIGLIFN